MKTNHAPALPESRPTIPKGIVSKYAIHNALLLRLHQKFPTITGKSISFEKAFAADPSLRKTLGIKKDGSCSALTQHVLKLVARSRDSLNAPLPPLRPLARKKYKTRRKQPALAAPPTTDPTPLPNNCYNCGAHLAPLYHVMKLMQKLK